LKYLINYESVKREITKGEAREIISRYYRNADEILKLLERKELEKIKIPGGFIYVK